MDKHTKEYLKTLDLFESFLAEYLAKGKGNNSSFTAIASEFNKKYPSNIRTRPLLNDLQRKGIIYKEDNGNYGFIKKYPRSHYIQEIIDKWKESGDKLIWLIIGAVISFLSTNIPIWLDHKQSKPLKIELQNPKFLVIHDTILIYKTDSKKASTPHEMSQIHKDNLKK